MSSDNTNDQRETTYQQSGRDKKQVPNKKVQSSLLDTLKEFETLEELGALVQFVEESNRIEGITRAPTPKEIAAHQRFLNLPQITVKDLEAFVTRVQQGARLRKLKGMNVRVGSHYPPRGGPEIKKELEKILACANDPNRRHEAAWQVHVEYEKLHPFMDGNGRSGRVLWLWMMGGRSKIGFLHRFYYQTLERQQ